ncbi:MAG: hypothetical protein ACLVJH_19075 [Faecalibacterium prausnitzii]
MRQKPMCHNKPLFISVPEVLYEESCTGTAVHVSPEIISLPALLTKQVRKGKTNRDLKTQKVCFLLGCTKAQANLWPNLQEFFGKNHEEQLVLAD